MKPEMVKQGFYAVCSETTSWEQRVVVSVPEDTTEEQLEALGEALLGSEDEIQALGQFDRCEEQEKREITIHQGDHETDSDEALPCRLNDDGEWEIGGVHWVHRPGSGQGPESDDDAHEEYVAIRICFERLVPVEGYVDVWVPSRVCDKVDCGTRLAETLEEAVLDGEYVKWNDRVELRRAIRSPEMESVEPIAESDEACPALRGHLCPNGEWKILDVTGEKGHCHDNED
jgi:hypothetical protein